jgi:YfiH family protein
VAVSRGCASFVSAAGWPPGTRLAPLRQVHGSGVALFTSPPAGGEPPEADGAVTGLPGLALVLQTADCVPVILADVEARLVGAAHAGWRGALAGIVERTVEGMARLGARKERLQALVGPAIGPCCFEVGEDVAARFAGLGDGLVRAGWSRPHVDLPRAVMQRLGASGLAPERIARLDLCTACRTDVLFSYRREGSGAGRLLSAVAVLETRSAASSTA